MAQITFDLVTLKRGTLNNYIGAAFRNRFVGGKLKKELTEYSRQVTVQAMQNGIQFEWPGTIRFVWYFQNGRTDPDNWEFVQKYIFDGMQAAEHQGQKFLENDNLKNILGKTHEYHIDKENPRVELHFEAKGTHPINLF